MLFFKQMHTINAKVRNGIKNPVAKKEVLIVLANMTNKWAEIAKSLARFVLELRKSKPELSFEPINIYNQWVHRYGMIISDTELACWAIEHIENLLEAPISVLEEAIRQERQ